MPCRPPPKPNESPASLPGLGPVSTGWLRDVGIETVEELREVGAVAAFARIRHAHPRQASLNLLWGLYAAIEGMRWLDIDAETKARLKREAGVL